MAKNNMGIKTKNKILDAARTLFNEKGIDSTCVDEIAEKAGITKAMIYYHFDSKESIILQLVSLLLDNIMAELRLEQGDHATPVNMNDHVGKMMNVWRENKEIGLFIITKGIKDEEIFSKIIKISLPFFELLIANRNGHADSKGFEKEDSEKLFKLILFNTLPMILSAVLMDKFLLEFELPEETLKAAFRDEFVKVLNTILDSREPSRTIPNQPELFWRAEYM